MVAPIFNPNDREMIKYSPPPSTRLLVAISEMASAVGMVTICPIRMMRIAPQKPSVPTANPNLKNKIAPKIVEMAVKNTGAVPNLLLEMLPFTQVYFGYKKSNLMIFLIVGHLSRKLEWLISIFEAIIKTKLN